jgi:cation diffusion facilitator CzcD-associated flavoprotein CzcO
LLLPLWLFGEVHMASSQNYDAIVIGAGRAGTPLCQALAAAGMRTAMETLRARHIPRSMPRAVKRRRNN